MSANTPNTPGSLPAELVDNIIDDLSTDAASLCSAGLISRVWTPRTRQHLFHHITIGRSPEPHLRCVALKDIIVARPQIAGYIQSFDLKLGAEWGKSLGEGRAHGCCYDCEEEEEWISKPALRLVELLPRLGSVRSFRIEGESQYWPGHFYARVRRALYVFISGSKVKRLEMKNLEGVDMSVIARSVNLVEVVLENVGPDDWDEDEASKPYRHGVASGKAYDGLFQVVPQQSQQATTQDEEEEKPPTLTVIGSRYSLQTLVAVASYYKRRFGESVQLSKAILKPIKLTINIDMNDDIRDFAPRIAKTLFDLCGRTVEEYDLLVDDLDVYGDPRPNPFLTALPRLPNLRRLHIRTGPARCESTLPTLVQQLAKRAGAAETRTGLEILELTLDNSIDRFPVSLLFAGLEGLTKVGPQLDEVLGARTPGFQGLSIVVKTNTDKLFDEGSWNHFYDGRSGKERWERFVGAVEGKMKTLKGMGKMRVEIANVAFQESNDD